MTTDPEAILADDTIAALTRDEVLTPAGGAGIVAPPTFVLPDPLRYVIDDYYDEGGNVRKVALIDGVSRQARRLSEAFQRPPLHGLVPRLVVIAGDHRVDISEMGHRAADAMVRYSPLGGELKEAFVAHARGDSRPMARIAPLSLLLGAWDSRDTKIKIRRLWRSEIRAWNVSPLRSASVFVPPIPAEELVDELDAAGLEAASALGMRHAPSERGAGVVVHGAVRRQAILSLVGLRDLGPPGDSGAALRRYLFGLGLVALTRAPEFELRENCQLVAGDEPLLRTVAHDGSRTAIELTCEDAISYARDAAAALPRAPDRECVYDVAIAQAALDRASGRAPRKRRGRSSMEASTE